MFDMRKFAPIAATLLIASGAIAQTFGHWTGERAVLAKEWSENSAAITTKIQQLIDKKDYVAAETEALRFVTVASQGVSPLLKQARIGKWKAELARTKASDHEALLRIYTQLITVDPDNATHKRALESEKKLAATNRKALDAKRIAADRAKRRREGVSIGMTMDEVRMSSWGRPSKVNRTTTAYSHREQWVYDGSYLYFEDGKLTTIQN